MYRKDPVLDSQNQLQDSKLYFLHDATNKIMQVSLSSMGLQGCNINFNELDITPNMPFKMLPHTCTLTCISMPSLPNQEAEVRLYLVGGGVKPYSKQDVECKSLTAIFRLCRRDIKLTKEAKNIIEYEPT